MLQRRLRRSSSLEKAASKRRVFVTSLRRPEVRKGFAGAEKISLTANPFDIVSATALAVAQPLPTCSANGSRRASFAKDIWIKTRPSSSKQIMSTNGSA
jgi:hypothetical protein